MNETYNTKQIALILEVHPNTVYRYLTTGLLKGYKLGGNGHSRRRWKVKSSDLSSFMQGAKSEHGDTLELCSKPEQVADSAPCPGK